MDSLLNSQKIIKHPREVSGLMVVLFFLVMVIGVFSSEWGEDRLALSGIAGIVALVALFLRWRQTGRGVFAVFLGMAAGLVAIAWQSTSSPLLPVELQNTVIFFEGVILDRKDRGDSIQFVLNRGVVLPGQKNIREPIQIGGYIQVTVYPAGQTGAVLAIPGDRVRMQARLRLLRSFRNPGSFDYARFQRQRGILLSGFSKKPVEIIQPAVEKSWNRYRQNISQWIVQVLPYETQGLAEALMVGKRGLLNGDLKEDLLVSGTFHLVAISGLHLGLVAGWSFLVARLSLVLCFPLSRRWNVKRPAAILAVFPTLAYASLAGWSVSTQRAAVMVCLLLFAVAMNRSRQIGRVLNLAAIVVLLYQPWQLFSAGFQLSFVSVVGLLFLVPLLQQGQGWQKSVLGLFFVSLVAMLVTSPIAAYHFHRFSPYGVLANLLAVPWISLVSVPLGLLALLTHKLYPMLGDLLLQWMGGSLDLFRQGVAWVSALPGAWQRLPGPSLIGLALSLGFCALAALMGMVGRVRWRLLFFVAAFPALLWPRASLPEDQLHLAVLDVGQAQSVVLYTPYGGWSVLDVGGWVSARFNIGEAVTSAYLWYYGVQQIKRVVISHPQRDHMAGAKRLLRNFQVDSLWLGDFPEEEQKNSSYASLVSWAEQHGVQVKRIHEGFSVEEGDARVTVLPPLPKERAKDSNSRSLVVEVTYAGQRFLFPGDATAHTEKWLLDQNVVRHLTVLLAPHHGSKFSSIPAFVRATHPQHIVFSVGHHNRYHHPHIQVVERWRTVGAHLWRTDQQGGIIFQSDGRRLRVRSAEEPRGFLAQSAEALF